MAELHVRYSLWVTLKRTKAEVDERDLRHIKVWRDDLTAMITTVAEVASDIEMFADGYSFDSADDLQQIKEPRLADFKLAAADGRINLVLSARGAVIRVKSPDLRTRGMASEIERLARGRIRRFRSYAYHILVGSVVTGALIGLVVAATRPSLLGIQEKGMLERVAIVLISTFGVFVLGGTTLSTRSSSAIIYTRTQAEAPPWGKRNRDALVTNAIVSFIFLVIGVLVGYFLPK